MGKFWISWLNILCLTAGKRELFKSINTGDILEAVMTEQKLQQANVTKLTETISTIIILTWLSVLAAV